MTHLTEEQIDELLMGSLQAEEAAHLRRHAATCSSCAAQLEEIEAPLASFKAVTAAWSERRSATLPVRPAKPAGARWGLGFAWGSVAAAALLAAIIPVLRHEQNIRATQAYEKAAGIQITNQVDPATSSQPANTAANDDSFVVPENPKEIASDNQLLAMVDEELNAPIPTPGSAAPPITQQHGPSRSTTLGSVQD